MSKRLSKGNKIAIGIVAGLLALIVVVTVLIKVVVTPEKVRGNLLPLAENYLHRKVDVGDIQIGFFSGVSLTDFRVQNKQGTDDFISVKSLQLDYKLLPLLKGKLVIDQVLLENPQIRVVREPNGRFNFSDLQTKKEKTGAGLSGKADSEPRDSSFDLLVNLVSIKGGELLFIDRLLNPKAPYRYQIEKLNFQADSITFDQSFPLALSAVLNGSRVAVAGRFNITAQSGDFDLQLHALDIAKFSPYYRDSLPGKLESALLTVNLEAQFQPQGVTSKGMVQIDDVDLFLTDLPEAALQKSALGVNYSLSYDGAKQLLDLSTLLINLNGAALGAEGLVDLNEAEPKLSMALSLDQLNLRTLVDALPQGLSRDLHKFSIAGTVNGHVTVSGKPSDGIKLLESADLELFDVVASVEKLRSAVSGRLHYADQRVTSQKLVLSVGDQQIDIDVKLNDLLQEVVRGKINVTAKQFDLNPFMPAESSASQPQRKPLARRGQPSVVQDIGPFDLPLDISGDIQIGKLLYKGVTLDNVLAEFTLKDNQLKISQLRSGISGGELRASSDVDLGVKGLAYQGKLTLAQSNLSPLISGLLPTAKQNVSGLMQWQNSFSGRGTIPDNLLRSLQLNGLLNLRRGQITGSPILQQLALFLGMPELKILSFEAFEGRYDLRNGLAQLSGGLNSSKAKLLPSGTVGVDGRLDLKLDARLALELMQKPGAKAGLNCRKWRPKKPKKRQPNGCLTRLRRKARHLSNSCWKEPWIASLENNPCLLGGQLSSPAL